MAYGIIQDKGTHYCIECGEAVEYGRTDKKYCSLKCKNARHNREMRLYKEIRGRVTTAIARNYSILENLLNAGVSSIKLSDIQSLGFNIHAITSFYSGKAKSVDMGCYDILYSQSQLKIFNIRRVFTPSVNMEKQGG